MTDDTQTNNEHIPYPTNLSPLPTYLSYPSKDGLTTPIEIYHEPATNEEARRHTQEQSFQTFAHNNSIHSLSLSKIEQKKTKKPKKYKPVDKRTQPVAATLPEEYRIIRKFPSNPLDTLPELPTLPPDFTPGIRYTAERMKDQNINADGFLWPEEEKLVHHIIKTHEMAFAWNEMEKGHFRSDYFEPIKLPVLEHTPWSYKNIPIPPGIRDKVVQAVKDKIAAGVYEPSNSSYRSRWFCVPKKDGVSLRIVHDLQPLNAISIKDAGCPPIVEVYAESFGGATIYGMFDLFVGFDHRILDVPSRDYTTFQTPMGTFRLTRLPQGYTNSVQIQQGDVSFILQDEIPTYTQPFVDDCPVKGPADYYKDDLGNYETIKGNPGIRRFVWEHLVNVNRIIHRIRHAGGTFNAKKSFLAVASVIIVGHRCNVNGRVPDESKVQRIKDWPPCQDLTDVRAFLGTLGLMRIFIKNFSLHARPLVRLTRKDTEFVFGKEQQEAMEMLKHLLITSPALRAIDYLSERMVYLVVDSSWKAMGCVLLQVGEDGVEYPSRFGSITWNEREQAYSQAKIELYGLFRALRAYRLYIVGVKNLTVRTDAKYIKGMLNNPDIQPNAAINRWIAAIQLFTFTLEHIPGTAMGPADGLSRRNGAPEDPVEDDDVEEWIDRACGFSIELVNWDRRRVRSLLDTVPPHRLSVGGQPIPSETISSYFKAALMKTESISVFTNEAVPNLIMPRSDFAIKRDKELERIRDYLENPVRPAGFSDKQFKAFMKKVTNFFVLNDKLWRRDKQMKHKVVLPLDKRLDIMSELHDKYGHKAAWTTKVRLMDRFWWPSMTEDVTWFVKTCHQCQLRNNAKIHIPPTVAVPFPLFGKIYMDTMHLPTIDGFHVIAHGRCSLSSYPEWRMLKSESAVNLANFIFEDILCRWGSIMEIVTDNGKPWVKAADQLRKQYGINHIRISGYNSQAQGIIERKHYDVRESLIKSCDGNQSIWPKAAHAIFWAERITIQKSTGYSPYYIAHGVQAIHPFDLEQSTYMHPFIDDGMDLGELITRRAMKLQRREKELSKVQRDKYKARLDSVEQFLKKYEGQIYDFKFSPGRLVLIRNTRIEKELNNKMKPRYIGPMVVVRQTKSGSYILSEVSGAIAEHRFAAHRLVPYFRRNEITLPVTTLVGKTTKQLDDMVAEDDAPDEYTLVEPGDDSLPGTYRTRLWQFPRKPEHEGTTLYPSRERH